MADGHNFRVSGFERREKEQYFTQPWCTRGLLKFVPDYLKERVIWEPAAGRGDIAQVLVDNDYDVVCSDIDITQFNPDIGEITEADFLSTEPTLAAMDEYSGIITNPPYGGTSVTYDGKKRPIAEAFIRHSLAQGVDYVAMLMRTDYNHSNRRRDLFEDPSNHFAYEVVLTARPRWDWWYEKDPWEKWGAPMHNFSWFVWDRRWKGPSTQFFVNPKDVDLDDNTDDGDENEDE